MPVDHHDKRDRWRFQEKCRSAVRLMMSWVSAPS
jgi:hypothetical protein